MVWSRTQIFLARTGATRCIALAIGAVLSVLVSVLAQAQPAASAAPRIVVPKREFDFGRVQQGTHVVHEFVIRNDGGSDLLIQRITPSCGCTATAVTATTVPAGKEERLKVDFDTAGFSGEKTKTVEVVTNDPLTREVLFVVRGEVLPAVVIEPEFIHFGEVAPSAAAADRRREFSVSLRTASAGALKVSTLSPFLAVSRVAGGDDSGGRFVVELVLDPAPKASASGDEERDRLPVGSFRDRILVEVEGDPLASFNIPVFATIRRSIRASPQSVSFGVLRGETPLERRVQVRSSAREPVQLALQQQPPAGVELNLRELSPGKRWELMIKVDPKAVRENLKTEDLKTRVELTTTLADEPSVVINIFGTQPLAPQGVGVGE